MLLQIFDLTRKLLRNQIYVVTTNNSFYVGITVTWRVDGTRARDAFRTL